MNRRDDANAPTSVANDINSSQSKMWERRFTIVAIIAASIGLVVCTSLLVQAYITHKPGIYPVTSFDFFKPELELLGYSSEIFLVASLLALFIALNLSTIFGEQRKQFSYASILIGFVLMSFSFGLFFISHKPKEGEQEWLLYLFTVSSGLSYITRTIFEVVGTKRQRLRDIFKFTTIILVFTTVAFLFT